mmetsp:Transcript_17560/g.37136  ORF Transcript_17560/g.37136 Transcript_17560/m.37136 type:complete len:201 (+) Transcript_17560:331-933(+)
MESLRAKWDAAARTLGASASHLGASASERTQQVKAVAEQRLGCKLGAQSYQQVKNSELDTDAVEGAFTIDDEEAPDVGLCVRFTPTLWFTALSFVNSMHRGGCSAFLSLCGCHGSLSVERGLSVVCRATLSEKHKELLSQAKDSITATETQVKWLREERMQHEQTVRHLHELNGTGIPRIGIETPRRRRCCASCRSCTIM